MSMRWRGDRNQSRQIFLTVLIGCLGVFCLMGISFMIFSLRAEKTAVKTQQETAAKEEQKELSQEDEEESSTEEDAEKYADSGNEREAGQKEAASSSSQEENTLSDQVAERMGAMTTEQKVAQLFFVLPDSLAQVSGVTQVGEVTASAYRQYPVGGIVYMEGNIVSEEQITAMNESFRSLSQEILGVEPFLSVDEEGGSVTRIACNPAFPVTDVGDMAVLGSSQDASLAYQAGQTLGSYLNTYGFNMDFAPVADVLFNDSNTVVKNRSFGSDPQTVASMVSAEVEGLKEAGIHATLKHFPGHGATAEDSHNGYAYADRSMEQLRENELVPFQAGMDAGADFVMVGHLCFPQIDGSERPASLAEWAVSGLLKEELGFEGVAVTDAMNMGAIANHYSSAEAAVLSIQAGMDMILMPADFQSAYEGVLAAVQDGRISQERLTDALTRILTLKLEMAAGR